MKTLSIDIETYSDIDLNFSGVYRYASNSFFNILLFAYSVDGGEVQVVDLMAGQEIPTDVLEALTDPNVTKWAFNASFERVCLSEYLRHCKREYFKGYGDEATKKYISPRGWKCTMTWAAYMGLPLSLQNVGLALDLDEKKMEEGKDLIRYFCTPCKPTKANGGRTRNLPAHAPNNWKLFKAYNKRDVEVEMSVQHKLRNFPVPESVWEEYWLDQEINDRGIMIDRTLVSNAICFDKKAHAELMKRMQQITEVENPNSVQQMKVWLKDNGLEMESLGKKEVAAVLKTAPPEIAEVLTLRQMLSKSSVRKYRAMEHAVCMDGRARGLFMFYGANRSGRFSSKIIQIQNLYRNSMPDLNEARELVRSNNYEATQLIYENVPETLSELIRTAFIPKPGYKFIVADFSAIEARVLSWLAKEQWRMDTFASGGDIYCATASKMFHCNVVKHGENGELRQKGKAAELACGYSGGKGALINMGAIESGMKVDELQPLVDAWREANPNIVKLWYSLDNAAKKAVQGKTTTETHGIKFICQSGMLFMELPSGRHLSYVKPMLGENRFGGQSVTYMGTGLAKKWERIETFGGRLTENCIQAIARDILCFAMKTLSEYRIVAHVHDEIIIECQQDTSLEFICKQMSITPPWAEGLVLNADGYECQFYKKD